MNTKAVLPIGILFFLIIILMLGFFAQMAILLKPMIAIFISYTLVRLSFVEALDKWKVIEISTSYTYAFVIGIIFVFIFFFGLGDPVMAIFFFVGSMITPLYFRFTEPEKIKRNIAQ